MVVRLSRVSVIHLVLVLFAAALIGQAGRVQLVQGRSWVERAKRQQYRNNRIAAPRGSILDASGNILVESREMLRISMAPNEVKDATALSRALRDASVPRQWRTASVDKRRRWVTLPGLYAASDVSTLVSLAGVHADPVMSRAYASGPGLRRIVGALDPQGRPLGGIELALDSVLRGDTVVSSVARDVRGRRLDNPETWEAIPRPGNSVTLTINRDLQDICERALAQAVDSLEATGGDILVINPNTGDVLAMASRRAGHGPASNTAVTEPFEPGSTLKPFIAAALLEKKRAKRDDVVNTYNGVYVLNGRRITDEHKSQSLRLADVIRYSSNIGIVQFGDRLTAREKYETLRDIGLGTQTGVPIPGESDGTLREPARWSATSSASVTMGYEVSVTPLQLVAAYSALANGGELLQAHVVKEIRSPDGDVLYRAKRRVLRRVFSERVAGEVREFLKSVVDSGTAVKADLAAYDMAGKSGTARRTIQGRGYVAGNYTASFVGVFPAEKPQYVVLVKFDSPRAGYFGGDIAAPVTAVVLRAALAARDAALNRTELANVEHDVPLASLAEKPRIEPGSAAGAVNIPGSVPESTAAALPSADHSAEVRPGAPKIVQLPYTRERSKADRSLRPVPDVQGLTTRDAVHALHAAGFRVTLAGRQEARTIPAAGTLLPAGSVVKLQHIP
jgi:cell division protein FtsI (penicillin-binding protein 3)